MQNSIALLFKPETHRLLYILLLIATPFLLLQNYLQSLIGEVSNLSYSLFNLSIPVTVTIAVMLGLIIIVFSYRKINSIRIWSWLFVIFLFWIGQQSTDFYFNHKFYELQYNWHYFAYAIFAYLNYRVLSMKNIAPARIILLTFFSALATSTLDELLQIPLSNRIFDMGDISKDLWGAVIGLFFIFFILENGKLTKKGWNIRHKKARDYIKHPLSTLFLGLMLAYIFMVVTSILTLTDFIGTAILITMLVSVFFFGIFHYSQFKRSKRFISIFISIIILVQLYFFYSNFNKNISHNSNQLLIYKGIPIYYFDVLVYPNGLFRLVDKKKSFNQRDQQSILNLAENIIVIGSGSNGSGGQGFPKKEAVQFLYHSRTNKGVQLVVMANDEACKTFNRLKTENKRPLLIVHNN